MTPPQPEIPPDLGPYVALIGAFSEGRLRAAEFEAIYLSLFLNDAVRRPKEFYEILNQLFTDVDAYCGDPSIRGPGDLDDEALKLAARLALTRLRQALEEDQTGPAGDWVDD